MPKKITKENCLAAVHPDVAGVWHPTKNGVLNPFNFTVHSNKKVWWKCPVADDHEWVAAICDVTISNNNKNNTGCPCCAGKKIVNSNCLATTHPDVAKLWHPIKNENTPFDVTFGSDKKVWWKCPVADDHEWLATISSVVIVNTSNNNNNINGCPCCTGGSKVVKSNCLSTLYPDVAKLWHPIKNKKLTPYTVRAGSRYKVWWQCSAVAEHEWPAIIVSVVTSVTGGSCGCPYCKKSKYETFIKNWLFKHNIIFQQEYTFEACRGTRRKLPFDFAIMQPLRLIEYQGQHHYMIIPRSKNHELNVQRYTQVVKTDTIKRAYCLQNNIPLLALPYTYSDEQIIENITRFLALSS